MAASSSNKDRSEFLDAIVSKYGPSSAIKHADVDIHKSPSEQTTFYGFITMRLLTKILRPTKSDFYLNHIDCETFENEIRRCFAKENSRSYSGYTDTDNDTYISWSTIVTLVTTHFKAYVSDVHITRYEGCYYKGESPSTTLHFTVIAK
jgi:hypothetical protein